VVSIEVQPLLTFWSQAGAVVERSAPGSPAVPPGIGGTTRLSEQRRYGQVVASSATTKTAYTTMMSQPAARGRPR
jgi:hypothetical protein